jgi:tetratricopeptide (TPR) repeat protein
VQPICSQSKELRLYIIFPQLSITLVYLTIYYKQHKEDNFINRILKMETRQEYQFNHKELAGANNLAVNFMKNEQYDQAILILQDAVKEKEENKITRQETRSIFGGKKTYWSRDGRDRVCAFFSCLQASTTTYLAAPNLFCTSTTFYQEGMDYFQHPLHVDHAIHSNFMSKKGFRIWQMIRMKWNHMGNKLAVLYYNTGRCHFHRQEYNEALQWYKKSIFATRVFGIGKNVKRN